MKVTAKLCGPLRKVYLDHVNGEVELDLPEGSTGLDAVEALGLGDEVRMLMHNGKAMLDDEPLSEGDRLTMIPPQLAFNMYVATGFLSPKFRREVRAKQAEQED